MNNNKKKGILDFKERGDLGEALVENLANHTYLKYWCFLNPKDRLGNKKEICDLLILFKDTLLIISIKNYLFKGNYERYFKSTIQKAIKQISGAERKLFESSSPIQFEHPVTGIHQFDRTQYSKVQRIIINLSDLPMFYPGGLNIHERKYAHIFNWSAFLGVVTELDTIPDLLNYLEERERVFTNRKLIFALGSENDWKDSHIKAFFDYSEGANELQRCDFLISGSEQDLLGDFLYHDRRFSEQYNSDVSSNLIVLDNVWKSYLGEKRVILKKGADQASYFVDELVKREIVNMKHPSKLDLAIELLALSRFERRILGKQFYEFLEKHKDFKETVVHRRYGKVGQLVFGLLIHDDFWDKDEIELFMELAMNGYIMHDDYNSQKILIVSINRSLDHFNFAYNSEIKVFPLEYVIELRADCEKLGWFEDMKPFKVSEIEYPKE